MTNIEMEAMEAVIGIRKELAKANEIEWEQRRYEIAKDYYTMACSQAKVHGDETMGDILEAAAWVSVVAADKLIEVLKK
ncbi:hypothetical protein [Hoylesella timonensis]|uniref:Phage protein n=1 Tax=Hoylesella timonensis S9-PR14 TaxID=1401062 RepID=A0A098YQW8_9BACT|nr:hypothetical protein [Hoylesella timonensis]KGI21781.1 hypothetical protein HMPREF9304_08275 [Hoylesella timonensis S9-PR14]